MSFGEDIQKTLSYNEEKVRTGAAELIFASNFSRDISDMGFSEKLLRFEKLNQTNLRAQKNTAHFVLSFSPDDTLDDEKMRQIAYDYMNLVGFGEQPYLVYKHEDTGTPHIHIVSSTIRRDGKAIYLHNLAIRKGEDARKALEVEYNLVRAEGRKQTSDLGIYKRMENNIRKVVSTYKYASLDELNAILRQFNIRAEKVEFGGYRNQKPGLVYCEIDKNGYKVGKPVKSSDIYTSPTITNLEAKFNTNANKKILLQNKVKGKITRALVNTRSTTEFVAKLKKLQIGLSVMYDLNSTITDISFVDHKYKTVFSCETLNMPISGLLAQLNYSRTNSESMVKEAHLPYYDDQVLKNAVYQHLSGFMDILMPDEIYQPDVSPEFLKRKRRKKKV